MASTENEDLEFFDGKGHVSDENMDEFVAPPIGHLESHEGVFASIRSRLRSRGYDWLLESAPQNSFRGSQPSILEELDLNPRVILTRLMVVLFFWKQSEDGEHGEHGSLQDGDLWGSLGVVCLYAIFGAGKSNIGWSFMIWIIGSGVLWYLARVFIIIQHNRDHDAENPVEDTDNPKEDENKLSTQFEPSLFYGEVLTIVSYSLCPMLAVMIFLRMISFLLFVSFSFRNLLILIFTFWSILSTVKTISRNQNQSGINQLILWPTSLLFLYFWSLNVVN